MYKNYYDILQVNRNASPEIIEKAFKTLAKKYHPDLQPEENKKQSEEIFKEINEAYEILSDEEKKKKYDQYLMEKEQDQAQQQETHDSYTYQTTGQVNNAYTSTSGISKEEWLLKQQEELIRQQEIMHQKEIAYQQELQQAREKAYHDAYIQDLKNRGYKIRYKKTLKEHFKNFIAIVITIIILFLLSQIPFIKNFLISLYEENVILRVLVDLVLNFFK